MNNLWAFLPMEPANHLLDHRDALRARLDQDGYLFFKGVLPVERLRALRLEMLTVLADHGWVGGGDALRLGLAARPPVREGDDAYFEAYDDIQRLEAFHTFAHEDGLMALMRLVLDDTAFA